MSPDTALLWILGLLAAAIALGLPVVLRTWRRTQAGSRRELPRP